MDKVRKTERIIDFGLNYVFNFEKYAAAETLQNEDALFPNSSVLLSFQTIG